MTQHLYRATFEDGTAREQVYSRALTHAWKVTYTYAANPDSEVATKTGFSGSRERAEAACKLSKRYRLISAEIVHAMKLDAPARATTAKPKRPKPFHKGETVQAVIGGATITGTVSRVGTKYTYISAENALADIKIATEHVRKIEAPMAVAA
jgi:hypothetical protein